LHRGYDDFPTTYHNFSLRLTAMNDNLATRIPAYVWRLVFAAALVAVVFATQSRAAECPPTYTLTTLAASTPATSWVFMPGRYTHDPATGARVAQYERHEPVEPLPDQRLVTSGYTRTRSVLRGADGSATTTYQVQSYGNGRGGMDAQWERFHDAWRGSTVAGGNFQTFPQFGFFPGHGMHPGAGWGGGFPGGGFPGGGQWHPGFPGGGQFHGGFGHGNMGPDARFMDPDGADGFPDGRMRTPDRHFFGPNQRFFPGIKEGEE